MKKVLIIANLFHASPRIPGLAKYLPEFGWQPIILTVPLGEDPDSRFGPPNDFKESNRVIETYGYSSRTTWKKRHRLDSKKLFKPAKPLLRFLYKHYLEIVNYPDEEKDWRPFAVKAGDEFLRSEDVDAIISSSSPVTCHLVAKELERTYSIPWVADLRDLWSQNHNYSFGRIRRVLDRRLELKTLSVADALVTVTPLWAEELKTLHKRRTVYTITNGFDPDKISTARAELTSKFTITYTGQVFYSGKQDPSKLFAALRELINEGVIDPNDVEIRFYNPENEVLASEIEKYGLSAIAKQYGIVPRDVSFKRQRESQLLLLFNWEDQRGKGWHSLKIFEYMAAQRPVLATGGLGNDAVKDLLDETGVGVYCKTVDDIKSTIRDLYLKYKQEGRVGYQGDVAKISKYSHREMARKYVEVLSLVTNTET